ncbi:LADA_0F10330g1_1 [Lachancea dasiensis]|uniref:LADA_0F10330g1_1 n=1 Tax=Lachancea dasiensis TaxID=1072105 RepID=A0A1G4JMA3_9SACH|nr:LADA_0F10330g1_1 [Lachancea dasiensis]
MSSGVDTSQPESGRPDIETKSTETEEVSAKRTRSLEDSDGVKDVEATEHKPSSKKPRAALKTASSDGDNREANESQESEQGGASKPDSTHKSVTKDVAPTKADDQGELAREPEKDIVKELDKNNENPGDSVKEVPAKPKFAFGSSSNFSAGFGVATKRPESALSSEGQSENGTPLPEAKPANKPAAFGSGFAFGAGFCALNKNKTTSNTKVFENESEKAEKVERAKSSSSTASSASLDEKKGNIEGEGIVKLTKQEVKSGEESEQSNYQVNAKLYQLSDLKEGWKERGVGALHVNVDRKSGKGRVVMRSRGILKVILNLSLIKGVAVHRGFPASLNGEKFIRIVAVDHEKTPVQYALKTAKAETATELYDHIVKLIPS